MTELQEKTIVVAGGTGNVGAYIVYQLLVRGARVVVPSRSDEKINELRAFLRTRLPSADLHRLRTLRADTNSDRQLAALAERIETQFGQPSGVIAALGRFRPAPTLLQATADEMRLALDDYLLAHFAFARTFLPIMQQQQSRYIMVNGPMAFEPWPGYAAGLVSVATAAQHMMFRVLAAETPASQITLLELVIYGFIRDRETQPGSAFSGEEIGAYVANMLDNSEPALHGQTLHYRPEPTRELSAH